MEINDFRITGNTFPINTDFYQLRLVINRAQPRYKLFEMISHRLISVNKKTLNEIIVIYQGAY